MIIQPNYVIIQPHANHTAGASHGVEMPDFVNEHFNFAVTGTVVQVCEKIHYFGRELRTIKGKHIRSVIDQRLVQDYLAMSQQFDVPVEIEAGDTVVFPYLWRVDDAMFDEERFGGFMVLRYDQLTAKVVDGKLYPLNGAVLGRKVKSDQGVMQLQREYWDGRMDVTHEGCLVSDYMDYGYPDQEGSLVGKQVFVNPRMPISIEVPSQLRLADEELFQVHRRHIVGIIQN